MKQLPNQLLQQWLNTLNQQMVTSSDLATAPTMAGNTADMLDSQLSNELASEAIAEVINTADDTGQQMDINDAINAATKDAAPADLDTQHQLTVTRHRRWETRQQRR